MTRASASSSCRVDFEPLGRRVEVSPRQTLLEAAQNAGVALAALCGGNGQCQACRVRLVDGMLSPPTSQEAETFSPAELAQGLRLACQAYPRSNVKINIPPGSLTSTQRLQLEGAGDAVALDPPVTPLDLDIPLPGSSDLRADDARLNDSLAAANLPPLVLDLAARAQFSTRLRECHGSLRLAVRRGGEVAGVLPRGADLYGFAVDIGTTKLAAYLVRLEDATVAARAGAMNPQIAYGEDVVSRIAYANQGSQQHHALQAALVETLNELLAGLCRQAAIETGQVVDAVLVGNTAMSHLLAGLPVRPLGEAPYIAAAALPLDIPAQSVGLALAPGANVHLPPNIAGYVGGDHLAMLLATGAANLPGVTVALDVGTNTEITLAVDGQLWCCSCASGPAFEGAHISAGMRAAPGAIERVQHYGGAWHIATIDGLPPVGICGSGILDAVAEMLAGGVIDSRGALQTGAAGVVSLPRGSAFRLVDAAQSGHGSEITITRKDVNEIQLAKAAIRTGLDVLLLEAGLTDRAIDRLIVAGAFGTYLNLGSAIRIGMFPALPEERFRQVGNAAGAGARQLLVSLEMRQKALEIQRRERYIELTTHPVFSELFVKNIGFS